MPGQKIETGHTDIIHDVSMDYYGKRVASASSDATIKIINASTSQHLATLTGHNGPIWQVSWAHPKFGSLLASCSYDGTVIIWKEGNLNEWTLAHTFTDHKSSVNSIAWAPHELGLCLGCGSSDGSITIHTANGGVDMWDTATIDQAHPVGVSTVSWAPPMTPGSLIGSGVFDPVQKLASGGHDNTVKIWSFCDGVWRKDGSVLRMHSDLVRDVGWAPSLGLPKSTIASGSQDGKVVIWSVGGKEGEEWKGKVLNDFKAPVWRVSWSLTGNLLAVASGDNNVTLWKEALDGEWQQMTNVE